MDHRPRLRTWLCVLATLLSLSSTLPAFAAESLQRPSTASPLSSKTLLTDSTLAGQRIVAVGTRGHIVYSDDQGKSFSQAAVPTRMLLILPALVDIWILSKVVIAGPRKDAP